jgi:hypothetical protein
MLSCAAPGDGTPPGEQESPKHIPAREPEEKQDATRKESPGKAEGPRADNSDCLVCHLNLEKEPLVATHAGGNVGCTDCHGDSWDHADDEGHETPPDILYPLEKIDPACGKCHPSHDVPARKVLARWLKRNPGETAPRMVVCTACHGRHRLETRTVRWDRKTGELIEE